MSANRRLTKPRETGADDSIKEITFDPSYSQVI